MAKPEALVQDIFGALTRLPDPITFEGIRGHYAKNDDFGRITPQNVEDAIELLRKDHRFTVNGNTVTKK